MAIMSRLTFSFGGVPASFSPMLPSRVRQCQGGNVNVMELFLGADFNLPDRGLWDVTSKNLTANDQHGNVNNSCKDISFRRTASGENNGFGEYTLQSKSLGYQFPEMKMLCHCIMPWSAGFNNVTAAEVEFKLESKTYGSEHSNSLKLYRGTFADSTKNSPNGWRLWLEEKYPGFIMPTDGRSYALVDDANAHLSDITFEYLYNKRGKTKVFLLLNFATLTHKRVEIMNTQLEHPVGSFIPKLTVKHNGTGTGISNLFRIDKWMFNYPKVNFQFDKTWKDDFLGAVRLYDLGDIYYPGVFEVVSRDYNFLHDFMIENGLIRVIITKKNPLIKIYGWNYLQKPGIWEPVMTISPEDDTGHKNATYEYIKFEKMSKTQMIFTINFGTVTYKFTMTRGDPYITIMGLQQKRFAVFTRKLYAAADIDGSRFHYKRAHLFGKLDMLDNDFIQFNQPNNHVARTLNVGGFLRYNFEASDFIVSRDYNEPTRRTINDSWFAFFNSEDSKSVSGFINSVVFPSRMDYLYLGERGKFTFTYEKDANVFGVGVLCGNPSERINPDPAVLEAPDGYSSIFDSSKPDQFIKWRAMESLFAFKESEVYKRK